MSGLGKGVVGSDDIRGLEGEVACVAADAGARRWFVVVGRRRPHFHFSAYSIHASAQDGLIVVPFLFDCCTQSGQDGGLSAPTQGCRPGPGTALTTDWGMPS